MFAAVLFDGVVSFHREVARDEMRQNYDLPLHYSTVPVQQNQSERARLSFHATEQE